MILCEETEAWEEGKDSVHVLHAFWQLQYF